METMQGIALRGICANYFENSVAPVLKYVQQAQEQLNVQTQELKDSLKQQSQELKESLKNNELKDTVKQQIQELRDNLGQKANAETSLNAFKRNHEDLERLAAKVKAMEQSVNLGNSGVSMLGRIQDLQSMMQKKVDIGSVPTMEHLKNLRELVQQKANAKDVVTPEMLKAALQRRPAASAPEAPVMEKELTAAPELTGELELGVDVKLRALRLELEADSLKQLGGLREELQERIAELESRLGKLTSGQQSAAATAEVKKMQVVMSAASSNFNRQLKDVKQQLQSLRQVQETCRPTPPVSLASLKGPMPDPRTPETLRSPREGLLPRENSSKSEKSAEREETMSLPESDEGSVTASVAGSTVSGLSLEERAELKKMQAVVSAAGTVFNKELRDVKKQVKDLQSEVELIKATIPG
mmetsp:Transcript_116852/g.225369  ORF Transcript_116852/g.225369 Transcript_116852/m.225369 type:complete len:414 (-) Transcript_116852:190-1431(-)